MAFRMELFYVSLLIIGSTHYFAHAMHGGVPYEIEKVPYLVQLHHQYEYGLKSICGGAILSDRWILTASHCIHTGKKDHLYTQVRVGTNKTLTDGTLYNISRIVKHEEYSVETRWLNDISLIELKEPIEFNNTSQPITISEKTAKAGNEVSIAGYGDDNGAPGEYLKMGHQIVITHKECRKAYKNRVQGKVAIDNRVFCVSSSAVDLGSGDSGSPVVLNGKIVGIAVEGAEAPLPNIHVNVAHYYNWIADTTGIKFEKHGELCL